MEASKASVEPTPVTDDKDATQDKSKELKDAQAGGDYDLATVRDEASEAGVQVDSKVGIIHGILRGRAHAADEARVRNKARAGMRHCVRG